MVGKGGGATKTDWRHTSFLAWMGICRALGIA